MEEHRPRKKLLNPRQTYEERQRLKADYRSLRAMTEQTREGLIADPSSLKEAWDAVNTLHDEVFHTSEAVYDTAQMKLLADIGTEQLRKFAKNQEAAAVSFEDVAAGLAAKFRLPGTDADECELDWFAIGKRAAAHIRAALVPSFMNGPLAVKSKETRVAQKRQAKAHEAVADLVRPEEVTAPEKEVKAMTDERVDRLHKLLIAASQTADGRKPPKLSFFEYVVNPHSFPETIENIFDLSFLVRKGLARLLEQPHERLGCLMPHVYVAAPPHPASLRSGSDDAANMNVQAIIEFTYFDWENAIRVFDIRAPAIPSRNYAPHELDQQPSQPAQGAPAALAAPSPRKGAAAAASSSARGRGAGAGPGPGALGGGTKRAREGTRRKKGGARDDDDDEEDDDEGEGKGEDEEDEEEDDEDEEGRGGRRGGGGSKAKAKNKKARSQPKPKPKAKAKVKREKGGGESDESDEY